MGYRGMFYLSEEGMLSWSFIHNVNSLSSVPPSYLKMYIHFHNLRCNQIIKTKITLKHCFLPWLTTTRPHRAVKFKQKYFLLFLSAQTAAGHTPAHSQRHPQGAPEGVKRAFGKDWHAWALQLSVLSIAVRKLNITGHSAGIQSCTAFSLYTKMVFTTKCTSFLAFRCSSLYNLLLYFAGEKTVFLWVGCAHMQEGEGKNAV